MVDVRTVAGELILAIADDDGEKTAALLRDVAKGEVGALALIVQLAAAAGEFMRMAAGEEWRDVLNLSLLGLSVDGAGNAAADGD